MTEQTKKSIDYQTALALAHSARIPIAVDEVDNLMMESVYTEIENAAKSGQFQYQCRFMIGMRGIEELKAKGFRVSYDSWNEVYKIKWYPRGALK